MSVISGSAPRSSSSFTIASWASSTAQNKTWEYILPSPPRGNSEQCTLTSASKSKSNSTSSRSPLCTARRRGCTHSSWSFQVLGISGTQIAAVRRFEVTPRRLVCSSVRLGRPRSGAVDVCRNVDQNLHEVHPQSSLDPHRTKEAATPARSFPWSRLCKGRCLQSGGCGRGHSLAPHV